MTDKQKRDAAVDAFATAIKARLDEKAAEGYTGWDGDYAANALAAELQDDADFMVLVTANGIKRKQRCALAVDIGARSMMLHFRTSNARNQGQPPQVENHE